MGGRARPVRGAHPDPGRPLRPQPLRPGARGGSPRRRDRAPHREARGRPPGAGRGRPGATAGRPGPSCERPPAALGSLSARERLSRSGGGRDACGRASGLRSRGVRRGPRRARPPRTATAPARAPGLRGGSPLRDALGDARAASAPGRRTAAGARARRREPARGGCPGAPALPGDDRGPGGLPPRADRDRGGRRSHAARGVRGPGAASGRGRDRRAPGASPPGGGRGARGLRRGAGSAAHRAGATGALRRPRGCPPRRHLDRAGAGGLAAGADLPVPPRRSRPATRAGPSSIRCRSPSGGRPAASCCGAWSDLRRRSPPQPAGSEPEGVWRS